MGEWKIGRSECHRLMQLHCSPSRDKRRTDSHSTGGVMPRVYGGASGLPLHLLLYAKKGTYACVHSVHSWLNNHAYGLLPPPVHTQAHMGPPDTKLHIHTSKHQLAHTQTHLYIHMQGRADTYSCRYIAIHTHTPGTCTYTRSNTPSTQTPIHVSASTL